MDEKEINRLRAEADRLRWSARQARKSGAGTVCAESARECFRDAQEYRRLAAAADAAADALAARRPAAP